MEKYLIGEQISRKELKKHIGERVEFLERKDIDRSGRGYFFPQYGTINRVERHYVYMENERQIPLSSLVEIVKI